MDKYFIWIHYERLHNHNKAKHNKTVCIFLVIYCSNKASISTLQKLRHLWIMRVYSKKYAHGFVVLCFVVVMQSFIMNSHEVFIHVHQSCFAGTGAIVRLPQCQWSKADGYAKISQSVKCSFGVQERFSNRGHYLKKNLIWLKFSGLSLYIYILIAMFTMHFDAELSSVSIVSCSWHHNAGARELAANHTLQSMATACWWRRWQADGLLSCWYNGGHSVKSCRQKRSNYVRMGAISSQSYQQLVKEGLKILDG